MHLDRQRIIAIISGLGLAASVGLVSSSSPATAAPDLDTVKERVDTLYHEAEIASERYNDAKLELDQLQEDLDSLDADRQRQGRRLDVVREQVRDSVQSQLQGQGVSAVGQVVISDDPDAFVSQLTTMSAYNQLQQGMFADYATQLKTLDIRSTALERRTEQVAAVESRLEAEKTTVEEKFAAAQQILDDLEAEARAELEAEQAAEARSTPTVSRGAEQAAPTTSAPASGRAAAAVSYGLAQVGKAYVYGAAGPDAFDCSGLTMRAWGAAGVGLPHSSGAQAGSGASVSSGDLQPGDLVFYYSPISHVGMYVGNGTIVHAANPGSGVTTAPVFSMPYSGAVRPG